ncbi:hypothetical protein FJY93_00250 [Candidatus Kaiserbacteria bacterium]|nr:hypothetical protein [Candidatus Kaiserbacteria bacterium]
MKTLRLVLLYMLAALLVIILGGVTGWYFFLHIPQEKSAAIDAARGLGPSPLSFTGGSTQKNVSMVVSGESGTSTTPTPDTASSTPSHLWQVDKTPVAGMRFVKQGTTTTLHFVERANGFLFTADYAQRSTVRITETLMPKMYEAFMSADGGVIQRSLDESGSITTFVSTVGATTSKTSTSTEKNSLNGSYIAKNIHILAVHPSARSFFYFISNDSGGVDGMTASWSGTKPKKIFSSTMRHWIPLWLADNRLVITEGASDDLPGHSYSVASDGSLVLLLGNVPGLTILPHPSSKALIYGSSMGGKLTLFTQGVASTTPTALEIETIADKCVWLESKSLIAYCAVPSTPPSGKFLDSWYRGAVHTVDNWWKIDVAANAAMQIYSPKESDGVKIDVERPMIDPTGNYLAFINASDKSLWMLKIPQ